MLCVTGLKVFQKLYTLSLLVVAVIAASIEVLTYVYLPLLETRSSLSRTHDPHQATIESYCIWIGSVELGELRFKFLEHAKTFSNFKVLDSLDSKRFQSKYCTKVEALPLYHYV